MNKNSFGVLLFGLIVGASVLISEFFVTLPMPLPVYEGPSGFDDKYSCTHQNREDFAKRGTATEFSINVSRGFYDQKKSELGLEFTIKSQNPEDRILSIAVHFFTVNGRTTEYLATETILVEPEFDNKGLADQEISSSFKWLNDLERHDDLYIIVEPGNRFRMSKNREPAFELSKATPVLVEK